MGERHLHSFGEIGKRVREAIQEKGLEGLLTVAVGFAICPGDDIVALGAALIPGGNEVVVHQAVVPSEDNYKLRLPETNGKGRRPQKSLKTRSFKQ